MTGKSSSPAQGIAAPLPAESQVLAFCRAGGRSTPPRVALEQRLARAGLAIAAEMFHALEGTGERDTDVHAPTAVAILATLAAEFAQQSVCVNRRTAAEATASGWVLGGAADFYLFSTGDDVAVMTVWQVIEAGATVAGIARADWPDMAVVLAHAEAHMGTKPYPVLTVAAVHRPRALLRAAAARHRGLVLGLAADEGLCTPHEQALAVGAAVAHVLRSEAEPAVLLQVAAEAMVGGARLAPLPFAVA